MGGGIWFWAKEVLVGSGGLGISRIFPENLPPQALISPFNPFFSPSTPFSNSFTPQNPLSTSLDQAASPFLPLLPSFSSSVPFLFPLSPFLGPYRTLTEHLRNPSIGPPKGPKKPKTAFFRSF